ncbi:hypothetical protein FB45DRAFT_731575 [Roridomyces roridus]|uniref:CCHC-type domain-containing protein n=1 Tax=Roridomyces roridus TaxID=1738132 RepID=A0AAD7CL01_9AGAR|nr:hypothetical protein FB45DRAFT_731575 [Roridomyces roridus]
MAPEKDAEPTSRFTDQVTAENKFQANDESIPALIGTLANAGLSLPLTLFLADSLSRLRSDTVKTIKHSGPLGDFQVVDVSQFPTEDKLSRADYMSVYNVFLKFIAETCGPLTARGFALHYNLILSEPDLEMWFPAYLCFDQQLCSQFFTRPFIIDPSSSEYQGALNKARQTQLKRENEQLRSLTAASSAPPSRSGHGGRYPTQPQHERAPPRSPYERKEMLCFWCGRLGHGALSCSETTPSRHSRQCVIRCDAKGLFRLSDGQAVCFTHNLGHKCKGKGVNQALHICTLCSDPEHGAAKCTRN